MQVSRYSMKKLITLLVGVLLLLPLTTVHAVSVDPTTGIFDTGTTFDVQLMANPPAGDFNGVSVRLKIEGGEFTNFVPATGTTWIGMTQDCDNNTAFEIRLQLTL